MKRRNENIAVLIDPVTGKHGPEVKFRWNDISLMGGVAATRMQKIVSMINYEAHLIEFLKV